jgi:hypothetical protein
MHVIVVNRTMPHVNQLILQMFLKKLAKRKV